MLKIIFVNRYIIFLIKFGTLSLVLKIDMNTIMYYFLEREFKNIKRILIMHMSSKEREIDKNVIAFAKCWDP